VSDRLFVGPDDEPDRYRLVRQVGVGGEAVLWKAEVVLAGEPEPVAVKLHHRERADDPAWRQRWDEQATLLHLIKPDPGVVRAHAHFEGAQMHPRGRPSAGDRALYLVMSWIDGQTLWDWVALHPRPDDRIHGFRYLEQLARVLDSLHSGRATPSGRAVVHGDVSPGNVIINEDGQAVLVDFGLFQVAGRVTGAPSGTPGYRAPEVVSHGAYSPASDRYAFGALAYHVLTGEQPPADAAQLRTALVAMAAPPAAADQPAAADRLAQICHDDPAARPPAGQWLRELRPHSTTSLVTRPAVSVHQAPTLIGAGEPAQPAVPSSRARSLPSWLVALVSAAAAAVVVLCLTALPGLLRSVGDDGDDLPPGEQAAADPPASDAPDSPPASSAAPADPTSAAPPPEAEPIWLVNETPVEGEWETGAWSVDAERYERSVAAHVKSCFGAQYLLGFDLGREYERFEATIGLADDAPSQASARFVVLLDAEPVETHDLGIGQHVELAADVSGVLRLELVVDADLDLCEIDFFYAVWGDPRLYR
jgi:serine/threonine protein kinase